MEEIINKSINESIAVKEAIQKDEALKKNIELASKAIIHSYKNGKKVLTCGNGGSAADASHLAAELVGRFLKDRAPLESVSLNSNPSIITCLSNDYGYDEVFSRQVSALGKKGDILFAITTSGKSKNIINALKSGKDKGITTICLTGKGGGDTLRICDIPLVIPSISTPRIQESHIMIIHIICNIVENALF